MNPWTCRPFPRAPPTTWLWWNLLSTAVAYGVAEALGRAGRAPSPVEQAPLSGAGRRMVVLLSVQFVFVLALLVALTLAVR